MKFSDCLSAMVGGKVAVKGGVERTLLTGETMNVIEEAHRNQGWTQLKTFKTIDFDEEGWEVKTETMDVCGITFTRRLDIVLEETWISEERGIRIRRLDGGWECSTTGNGPQLVRGGLTAEVAVRRLLDEAKEAARMAARVLGTPVGGWQPIESAPENKRVVVCWAGDHREPIAVTLVKIPGYDTWVTLSGDSVWECTHWMPIPPVPEVSK